MMKKARHFLLLRFRRRRRVRYRRHRLCPLLRHRCLRIRLPDGRVSICQEHPRQCRLRSPSRTSKSMTRVLTTIFTRFPNTMRHRRRFRRFNRHLLLPQPPKDYRLAGAQDNRWKCWLGLLRLWPLARPLILLGLAFPADRWKPLVEEGPLVTVGAPWTKGAPIRTMSPVMWTWASHRIGG